jgi:Flp pilus assembly protein CpaB
MPQDSKPTIRSKSIAVGAFLLAAVLIAGLYGAMKLHDRISTDRTIYAVIAARDLPMEIRIAPEDLTTVELTKGSLSDLAIRDKSSVVGRRLILPLLKGDYVLPRDLGVEDGDNFPPPGMRAVPIRLREFKPATEMFSPGDLVDVFAVTERQTALDGATAPVLSGLTVISCETAPQEQGGRIKITTLLLSPSDAEKLAAVRPHNRVALRMTAAHPRSLFHD